MPSGGEGESAAALTPARRAVVAVGLGHAVEWYDFALYGALATVLGPVFFPQHDPATQLLVVFGVYGTALLIRPVGALIVGRLGDTYGRRSTLIAMIVLMAVATAAVGFLPGYAVIGVLAPVLLLLLRAVQGLAAGGELGVSSVFIFEHAPAPSRGRFASWQIATLCLGVGLGLAVAAALTALSVGRDATEWWRVAFAVALPLGLVGGYVRTRVSETPLFLAARHHPPSPNPLRTLWAQDRRAIGRGFALVAAGSLAFNTFFIFLPNHLATTGGPGLSAALATSAVALLITGAAAPVLGRLSDLLGRRPIVIGSVALLTISAVPMWVAARSSLGGLLLAQIVIGVLIAGALSTAMMAELFRTPVRSTGLALTAGLGTALIGGTAPLVEQVLASNLGLMLGPPLYATGVAAVALVALRRWPETAYASLDLLDARWPRPAYRTLSSAAGDADPTREAAPWVAPHQATSKERADG